MMAAPVATTDCRSAGCGPAEQIPLQRLDWPDGDFVYLERLWDGPAGEALFAQLRDTVDWRQHQVRLFGRELPAPRLSAWYGDDGVEYGYSGSRYAALPWLPVLAEIRAGIEAALAGLFPARFNGVLANRYRDGGDGMGWHSDDEPELGPAPVIASASFGAPRRFLLRHRASGRREELLLGHGSLLVMAGPSQRCWQHAVPKTRRLGGERINLTFRRIDLP